VVATSLYDVDFYKWSQEQAQLLRLNRFNEIDKENIIEEIEDMGKRQKQELRNRLIILLMHLIKWKYQPILQSRSWASTIKIQRLEIKDHMDENPSLKSILDELIVKAWKSALIKAEYETGIESHHFPQHCPWAFSQFMDDHFWPDSSNATENKDI